MKKKGGPEARAPVEKSEPERAAKRRKLNVPVNAGVKLGQPAPYFKCQAVVPLGCKLPNRKEPEPSAGGGDDETSKAPEITLISLDDYKGSWLILFFYPLDFTFVCPTEICEFSERAADFRASGCEVLACSIDSVYTHMAWMNNPKEKGGIADINIPLMSDVTREVSKAYECLMDDKGHTCRATFIIDAEGKIRHKSFQDPAVGRNVSEYLWLVHAYQTADITGEACPRGWIRGGNTIKTDPIGKLEYFQGLADGDDEEEDEGTPSPQTKADAKPEKTAPVDASGGGARPTYKPVAEKKPEE